MDKKNLSPRCFGDGPLQSGIARFDFRSPLVVLRAICESGLIDDIMRAKPPFTFKAQGTAPRTVNLGARQATYLWQEVAVKD